MDNIIISNNSTEIINKIISEGLEKLHIVADFDKTLTKAFHNGLERGSLISVLYNEGHLSEHYQNTAQGYFKHYHAIEIDPKIGLKDKQKAMLEWWTKHKKLLVEEGLSKENIYEAIKSENLTFRDGVKEFFDFLNKKSVEIVILSAGGLGVLSMEKYLENNKCMYDNVHIVGNDFIWDDHGRAIAFKKPIIHSMNKNFEFIKQIGIFEKVKNKKNVILLGDSPSDVDMIKGFNYDNLLKIGFLNKNIEKNLETFKSVYDVVILNDGNFDFVNNLLNKF